MKKQPRNTSLYIRCSYQLIKAINDICIDFNLSQADVVDIIIGYVHDDLLFNKKECKLWKYLKRGEY